MLDVVTTSFYIKSDLFGKDSFEQLALALFDEWDGQVAKNLQLTDYSLTLVIEEGSIKGSGKIAASAAVLYIAIGNYGDFIAALATIKSQVEYVTSALFQQAKSRFNCETSLGNTKRSGGEIFYLERLFHRVRLGALSPDQAMQEIRARWGEEAASSPDFMRDLAKSLEDSPHYPEQLSLSDDSWESCTDVEESPESPRPRLPREPEFPIPQHFRVEISRLSKGEQKKIRLTRV
ncbi:MAG: hypothetical protein AB7T07_15500 [Steroidobacteraceae bacterium]